MATEYAIRVAADAQDQTGPSYHAFRYNVRPETIDNSRPAKVEIAHAGDGVGSLTAEFRTESDDPCYYSGSCQPAKETDCILIWDEHTESYTLHRIATFNKMTRSLSKPAPVSNPKANPIRRVDNLARSSSPASGLGLGIRSRSSSPAPSTLHSSQSQAAPPSQLKQVPRMASTQPIAPATSKPNTDNNSDSDEEEGESESDSGESDLDDLAARLN